MTAVVVAVRFVRWLVPIAFSLLLLPAVLASASPQKTAPRIARIVFADQSIFTIRIDGLSRRRLTRRPDSDPTAAPRGPRIAFVRGLLPAANEEIFTLNRSNGVIRRLTHYSGADFQPAWSPNERRLAFVRAVHGKYHLFVMNSNGTEQRQLVPSAPGSSDLEPAWSPSGNIIAFTRSSAGSRDLYVFDVPRRSLRKLLHVAGSISHPTWSSDGQSLAFAVVTGTSSYIYAVNRAGTGLRQVTAGPYDIEPSWAPIGSMLAFVRVQDNPPPPGPARRREIHVVNLNGGADRRVTDGTDPDWLSS